MVVNETLSISRSPESIWAYWMDVTNDVYWRTGIIKARWTSQPPFGIGSTGEHIHEKMGAMIWEVTRYEEGSSFEFKHMHGGLKGSIAFFQVEPENDGSRIQVQMNITGPFIMRIMMIFMRNLMRKSVQEDIQKLKDQLEQ